jgi:hypothetical protein
MAPKGRERRQSIVASWSRKTEGFRLSLKDMETCTYDDGSKEGHDVQILHRHQQPSGKVFT